MRKPGHQLTRVGGFTLPAASQPQLIYRSTASLQRVQPPPAAELVRDAGERGPVGAVPPPASAPPPVRSFDAEPVSSAFQITNAFIALYDSVVSKTVRFVRD